MYVFNVVVLDSDLLVSFFFFLAHLCHQRKWKDEIQDLTLKGTAPVAMVTHVTSQLFDICSQMPL